MFFPRKIETAKPIWTNRETIRDSAAKARARFRIESNKDIAKVYAEVGGKTTIDSVYDRVDGKSDEFVAFGKNDYLVALTASMRLDEMAVRALDTAKALAHVLLHVPGHLNAHGEGVAMVIPRQGKKDLDDELVRVHNEALWFAVEIVAPRQQVDALVASLGDVTPEIAGWRVAEWFGLPRSTGTLMAKGAIERLKAPLEIEAA